jgi:hypothetical protein
MGSYRLKVQRIENTCLFELSWGQGQQLMATVPYPAHLTTLYQNWQRAYLSFYKTIERSSPDISLVSVDHQLRARVINSGQIESQPIDWQAKLVQAETSLLNGFYHWLRSAELFEIRAAISRPSPPPLPPASPPEPDFLTTTVFLTCQPLELARFPWESWEIGADFASRNAIRLIRTPSNIQGASTAPKSRPKARILAILGDDTGLNFEADRTAVQSLSSIATVSFLGWQPGQSPLTIKQQIQATITDPEGWDLLFFAGHSNETEMTGGELAIAPGTAMQMSELAPHLETARKHGLQVAIFNSCNGLNIAESLIGLGFSQVVVMREPIHNRVAQEFLLPFLSSLAAHHTLQEALVTAIQFLRLERNLTYPSAYLVPSLFAHPGAELFHLPPCNWKQRLKQSLPTRLESVAIAACLTLSLVPSVQPWLLDQRIALQAVYRDLTRQVPAVAVSPVTLVQVDEESIRRDRRIAQPTPISRAYLADLVSRLAPSGASIIAIDYLLDRPVGGEPGLNQALQSAVQQQRTWFVFGAPYNSFEAENIFALQQSGVAKPEWSMQGYVSVLPPHMTLPYPDENCRDTCPLAYLLALLTTAQQELPAHTLPQPNLTTTTNLRSQVMDRIDQYRDRNEPLATLERSRFSPISVWFYETLGWTWLEPLLDFSIPPDRVYTRIAAWRVLNQPLPDLKSPVLLIGAGEYNDSGGIVGQELDIYPVPAATRYWRTRLGSDNPAASFARGNAQNSPAYLPVLTGSEVHAYILHHLLTGRLVVPVPDLWMVGLAVLLGKVLSLHLRRQHWQATHWRRGLTALAIASGGYGFVSLQLYISAAILLPWLLPTLTIWLYAFPALSRTHKG